MKKSKFTDTQIATILSPVDDRQHDGYVGRNPVAGYAGQLSDTRGVTGQVSYP